MAKGSVVPFSLIYKSLRETKIVNNINDIKNKQIKIISNISGIKNK